MPAVIYKQEFVYNWYIAGDKNKRTEKNQGDFIDYMVRPEAVKHKPTLENNKPDDIEYMLNPSAFNAEEHQSDSDIYYDLLEYMRNDDKSDGAFDSTCSKLPMNKLDEYRELERTSRDEGCPKYIGVLSFDNDYLRDRGILVGENGLDTARIKDIARQGINALIDKSDKLQNSNVYWVAAIHTNTDNVHVHYSLCEYHRLRERKLSDKNQDCLELSAIKSLKSTVANIICGKDYSREITQIKRQIIFPELSNAMGSAENLILDLANKLPDDIPYQYGNHRMKPFQSEIDQCVDKIIQSNVQLRNNFEIYKSCLTSANNQYISLYGEGSRADLYGEKNLEDFYNRTGNMLLKHIKRMKNNLPDEKDNDELEEKFSDFAVSERKENDSPVTDNDCAEIMSYLRCNNKYISNYAVAGKLNHLLESFSDDKLEKNIRLLKYVSDISDTAAFALGLYFQEKDRELSLKYLGISSEKNNRDAQYRLGKAYLKEKENEKAEKWLHMSADNGNSYAQFSYGMILYKAGQKDQAYFYLNKSDENGNKIAHRIIQNLKKNEFVEHIRKAIRSEDIPDDFKRSDIARLSDLADKGDINSCYELGLILSTDKFDCKDLKKAEKYLETAAEQNHSAAQYQLGKLYLKEKKTEKAEKWLKASAEQDNPSGQLAYGLLKYKLGSPSTGIEYIKRSAENGNQFASGILSNMRKSHGSKPPRVRQACIQSHVSSSACWYTLKQLMKEYDAHIKKLQAEFDYENNISNDYDCDYSYNY